MMYVSLNEFLKLPVGTLYMVEENPEYPLFSFDRPLMVKGETCGENDWWEINLVDTDWDSTDDLVDQCNRMMKGEEIPITETPSHIRYGLYPENDKIKFWVLTIHDHNRLIKVLKRALDFVKQEGVSVTFGPTQTA